MKTVFICSRYAGDIKKNVETAKKLCTLALKSGHAPFAPHLLYTQEGILKDSDEKERTMGIDAGRAFLEKCDEVWLYDRDGISIGMEGDLYTARWAGIPIVNIVSPLR